MSASDKAPAQWPPAGNNLPLATFAAGCFWGVELAFQRQPGVVQTCVGYTGGRNTNPTYEQVCSGSTGHAEAVQMLYDPSQVKYEQLVDVLYSRHNPRQKDGQGNDIGTQYRAAIFCHTEEQRKIAEAKKAEHTGAVTEIAAATEFYPAETYHQQYLEKGGRNGRGQSAAKQCNDPIRCYG